MRIRHYGAGEESSAGQRATSEPMRSPAGAPVRLINRGAIEPLLSRGPVIEAVRRGFIDDHHSRSRPLPARYDNLPDFGPPTLLVAKQAYSADAIALKIATVLSAERDVRSMAGLMLLLDRGTARLRTVLADDGLLTGHRTAAAGAVAAAALARPASRRLLVVGSGAQAYLQSLYVSEVLPIDSITIVARQRSAGERLVLKLQRELPGRKLSFIDTGDEARFAEALSKSDIIVTTTTSTAPLFSANWVPPGAHISAVGSDRPGKRELEPALLMRARYICDDWEQCHEKGEAQGVTREALRASTLGAVLAGDAVGRSSDQEITVFDSTGVGHQDLAIALLIERLAKEATL